MGRRRFSEVSFWRLHLTGCAFMISTKPKEGTHRPGVCNGGVGGGWVNVCVRVCIWHKLALPLPTGAFWKASAASNPRTAAEKKGSLSFLFNNGCFSSSFFFFLVKEGFLRGAFYLPGVYFWRGRGGGGEGWIGGWLWSIWMLVWCP